jgi:hypothetical protein
MTPGMSVATSRVQREWDAMRQSYGESEVITIPISSGASFVDPANSTIKFELRINITDAAASTYLWFWGNDSKGRQNALNLFSDMRLIHSSGYEVDRIVRGFAPWTYIKNAFSKGIEWHQTHGSLMRGIQTGTDSTNGVLPSPGLYFKGNDGGGGANVEVSPNAYNLAQLSSRVVDYDDEYFPAGTVGGVDTQYCQQRPFGYSHTGADAVPIPGSIRIDVEIPLSEFSGVFDTDMLSPSFLMAGSRLELTVQSRHQVFIVRNQRIVLPVAPLPTGWNISINNVKAKLETITFTDAVLRSISMTSANTGLEIPFIAVHSSQANTSTNTVSIQVNRAVSRANAIIVRAYPQAAVANTARTLQLDSVAAYNLPLELGFQVKLGAEFMPATPILGNMALYQAAQIAFGNWKSRDKNTVTIKDFCGSGQQGYPYQYQVGEENSGFYSMCPWATLGIMAMTLEKSSTLAQSGSPISSARDLNVVFGGAAFAAYGTPVVWDGIVCDIFVPHVALATVFLDSVLLRS